MNEEDHKEIRRPAHRLLTTDDIVSTCAGVTRDLLYKWRARGYLTRYGSAHAALWDWQEVERCTSTDKTRRQRVASATSHPGGRLTSSA